MEVHDGEEGDHATPATLPGGFVVKKQYGSRYWMVIDPMGELVCLTVYKKGAIEVVRRLAA
jgi:hypothetical protein